MSEDNNQVEETEPQEQRAEENPAPKRGYFTRRNVGIGFGLIAILAVVLALFVTVSYRYGVFDNYIKAQFVAKLSEIGIVFDAETFRVTVNPLKLELKNATFNNKVSGEKLFFIREANLGLTIQNLYAWQLSRDISLDSTEINGAEVWVKFDENGKSNFSNLTIVEDEAGSRVNFKYDSVKLSLRDGLVHFGDVSRKISADAKNVALFFDPVNNAVPDEQKRYNFDLTSTESKFVYDDRPLEPIDIRAKGIADDKGAEISEFTLKTPIGESTLNGTLTDWEKLNYNFNINSTVDLTQTSNLLPIGTPLRGVGNFNGTVSGEGENYKVDGEITSESLSAANVYLKALNVAATVNGTNSMYEANGKAVAELLTFDDFRIDFPQIIGTVRGNGTDFKWLGELQAVALKSKSLSLGGLFISDAVADYKEKTGEFTATAGNGRARSFIIDGDTEFQNLQASNLKLSDKDRVTNISAPNARADSFKTKDFNLKGINGKNVRITDRPQDTKVTADNLTAQNAETKDAKLKSLSANGFNLNKEGEKIDIAAKNLRAEQLDSNSATISGLDANDLTLSDSPNETVIFSNNLKVAKVATDAAILGSLNIAGVRLTVRQGTIEGTSGDVDAGNIALLKTSSLPEGGKLENVKIFKPVFMVEPSGRYRATADMSLGSGVLGSITLGAAKANVAVNNDQATLKNLSANIMEGKVNGDATIALNNRNRSNINLDFNDLDLGKLLALQGGQVVPIEGKTTGKVNLAFTGTNFKTATGTLNADIAANAGNAERGLIPLTGTIQATATNGLFNLDVARLNTEKTEFSATGQFDLSRENSDLNIALNSSDASEIERIIRVLNVAPDLEEQLNTYQVQFAGNLNFNGTLTGNVSNPTISGRTSLDSLILRGRELGALSSDIFVSPETTEFRNGKLQERGGGDIAFNINIPKVGTDNITVQATLNKINTGNLLAALPIDGLPAQLQDFQAQTSGTINLTGLPNEMQGEANLTSGAGTVNGQPFDGFDSRVTFAGTLVNIEKFEAKFGDGFLRANGTYETETTVFDLNVEGKNIELARVRPFVPNSQNLPNIGGAVNLTAKATGEVLESSTYNINFSGSGQGVTINDKSVGAVTFSGVTENQQLNANLTVNFDGQPQTLLANVNFADENLPFRAETTFNNSQLAPFIALIREPVQGETEVTGTATGRIFLAGNLSSVDAQGNRSFSTDNLSGSAEFAKLALQIGDTPIESVEPVSVTFNTREVVINSARFTGGGSNLVVSGTKALTADGMNNLAVDGNVNLSIFNAISKDAFFAGIATVAVRLTGVNSTARLNGTAELKNSSLAAFVGSERLTLERINGRILFTSNQAQIDQLTGYLGGGKVTASGGALLEGLQLQQFRFDLSGNDITAPLPPDFVTTGDANIQLTGFRENGEINSLIAGTIRAKRSVYTKDIDLADVLSGRSRDSLSEGGDSGSSFLGIPKLDIQIEGRDALTVRNNVADLTASVSLRFTGDVDFPQIAGRISATGGTVFFRNDRYEVQRGELVFPPNTSIEPYINLQAESEIRGYQVIVSLVGELSNTENLVANVRSNPALPQADVISLITTGNLANTDSGIPTLAQSGLNTAAELITDSLINDPARKATDKLFGLNVFEIDPSINGQRLNASARLTVGRRINRNLQVTYSTNLSQNQEQVLALEYRVSNRLSFVAQYEQRSLSNVTQRDNAFSFEVRLRKRF
jgi:translocation and assembly module TamB